MSDGMAIVADLRRRVTFLERRLEGMATTRKKAMSSPPRVDPESEAILRYLRSAKATEEDHRDDRAILEYLNANKKTGRAPTRPA